MSEKAILAKIEEVAKEPSVRACLLELIDFERGSENGRVYSPEYKSVLQKHAQASLAGDSER